MIPFPKTLFFFFLLYIIFNLLMIRDQVQDEFNIAFGDTEEPLPILYKSELYVNRPNAYEILHIRTFASDYEIKQAYRRELLSHHPDKMVSAYEKDEAEKRIADIREAYETLTTRDRCRHDLKIHQDITRYENCVNAWIMKEYEEKMLQVTEEREAEEARRREENFKAEMAKLRGLVREAMSTIGDLFREILSSLGLSRS